MIERGGKLRLVPVIDAKMEILNHSRTYGIGDTHTNTIENAFSLLKRGVYGTFHRVSVKHLGRYCNEFPIDSIAAGSSCRCSMPRSRAS